MPSFPASYDGVLGVGSINIEGVRAEGSQVGPYVDLVAPGEDVLAASRVAGHHYWAGTSFAAPFVSGAAALVRAAYPDLTAPEVAKRLLATADPAPGGKNSLEYGAGIVDPYRAVTEDLSDASRSAAPAVSPKPPDPEELREAAWWADMSAGAKIGAGLVVAAIAVAVILAVALPRARRRRWAATRIAELPDTPNRHETPDQVFLFPTGGATPISGPGGFPRAAVVSGHRSGLRRMMAAWPRCTAARSSVLCGFSTAFIRFPRNSSLSDPYWLKLTLRSWLAITDRRPPRPPTWCRSVKPHPVLTVHAGGRAAPLRWRRAVPAGPRT